LLGGGLNSVNFSLWVGTAFAWRVLSICKLTEFKPPAKQEGIAINIAGETPRVENASAIASEELPGHH